MHARLLCKIVDVRMHATHVFAQFVYILCVGIMSEPRVCLRNVWHDIEKWRVRDVLKRSDLNSCSDIKVVRQSYQQAAASSGAKPDHCTVFLTFPTVACLPVLLAILVTT